MKIRRIIALLLVLSFTLSFTACGRSEPKEITCDEIIEAYEDAGYFVSCHNHSDDPDRYSGKEYCYIIVYETEDSASDLAEITLYNTEEDAKDAADDIKYNIALWMFSAMHGEARWLESGRYGKVVYSSYNKSLLKPIKDLTK